MCALREVMFKFEKNSYFSTLFLSLFPELKNHVETRLAELRTNESTFAQTQSSHI